MRYNQSMSISSVLFVCQANVCRSPLAAGLMRCLLRERGLQASWRVGSAGTWAREGREYDPLVVKILQQRGETIFGQARCINGKMMVEYKLVFVMERGQKEALRVEFPEHTHKVYLLSEMVGEICSIEDPSGGIWADYERTAKTIEMYLRNGWNAILEMSAG